ncbi:MAG: cell division ATP-binding protein FtsE [Desulfobulbaceae bacterium]|nr:cell division ATP-binding protein FtsE [Desulfobulbaceae bacterium]
MISFRKKVIDTSDVMVDIIKVTKSYPPNVHALIDVSLNVNKGEIIFLTGMSGAGKTTLLRLLSRIERQTKGLVEVGGYDLSKLSRSKMQKLRRKIGTAYQDFKLLPERTVAQNIAITMEVAYKRPILIRKRIKKLLDQLGLQDKYNTPASELSRGEQQRVTIARAVANEPDLILADEPTGNLDHETTGRVMELFKECNKKGATLIIATHDESIYSNTNHRVMELYQGKQMFFDSQSKKRQLPSFVDELSFGDL